MEGHITIFGEIIPWQESEAGKYGSVNLRSVMDEITSQPKATAFTIHIHSIGGDVDEAFAIYDALKNTGKPLTTMIEGMCASAATIPALAADIRKMTENSQFMIHLPIAGKQGTAEEMREAAARLQAYEDKVMNLYMANTGSEKDAINAMMKEETWLTSEQALSLGFITEMIPTMKAVAHINLKNDTMTQMTVADFDKKFDEKTPGLVAKIMSGVKSILNPGAKMLTVTVADGKILDFGDAIQEESQIVVGSTATVDGSPAEGDFVLTDGSTLVFVAGAVTEIKPAESGDDVEALKKQIAEKDEKIAALEAAQAKADKDKATMEAAMQTTITETVKTEMTALRAEIKSDLGKEGIDMRKSTEGDPPSRKLKKDK